jgi:hypothetical protein
MAKPAKRQAAPLFKPIFIVAAAALIWGAQHEPDSSDIGDILAWALGMLTAGLLVQAALAVVVPSIGLLAAMLGQSLRAVTSGREER